MGHLTNSLKSLVSEKMIVLAAKTLDEKDENVEKAVSIIIPGLLALMMKRKGHSADMENLLREAGNLNIVSEIEKFAEERPSNEYRQYGDEFLQLLMGDKAVDFTNPIAQKAGISQVAANRLIGMMAPIVAGYLGNKLVKDNWTKEHLFNEIEQERTTAVVALPTEVIKSFDLENALGMVENRKEKKKSGSKSWLTWLLVIVLALVLIWAFRTCSEKDKTAAISIEKMELTAPIQALQIIE